MYKSYVESLYKIQSNVNKTPLKRKSVVKLLLSLLGRFGMKLYSNITELVNKDKFEQIVVSKHIHSEL